MRRARSISRITLVYLLLGFLMTWAVAWGLALLPPGRAQEQHMFLMLSSESPEVWLVGVGSCRVQFDHHLGFSPFESRPPYVWSLHEDEAPDWNALASFLNLFWAERWGERHRTLDKIEALSMGGLKPEQQLSPEAGLDDARGFPFVALWCTWQNEVMPVDTDTAPWSSPSILRGGIELPNDAGMYGSWKRMYDLRALPYYPIWSGLALNTAFYALLFFTIVRTLRTFKHARGYRRGLCPACKYDRTFEYREPCPECGHAGLKRRAASPT